MPAATSLIELILKKWGDDAAKVAVPAAGLMAAGQSEDADAAVTLRLLKEAPEAYNSLRKQLARDRQKGLSPMRTAEKFIHDQSMTNYDKGFNSYAYKVDGTSSGEYWKSGVQGLYDEILGAVDDPDPMVIEAMDAWLESHLGREAGSTMAQNRAKARAARAAGGGAAATAATGASAQESGFPAWPKPESLLTPPSTSHDMMIGNPMGAMGGSWGGMDSLFSVLDSPLKAIQGGSRLAGGLLSGEGWDGATSAAGGVIEKDTGDVQRDFADWISKKTGNSPLDGLFRAYSEWVPQLLGP
jgi:hypothetical protein